MKEGKLDIYPQNRKTGQPETQVKIEFQKKII